MNKSKSLLWPLAIALLLCGTTVRAEDPYGAIEAGADVVSNYVWRGQDVMSLYARQNGEQYGPNTGAWTLQPSITWITPVEGLWVNVWGSFALEGRDDVDSDHRIQTSPGGAFVGNTSWFDPNLATNIASAGPNANTASISSFSALPGLYKENNGTRRVDEVDVTIGYENTTSIGTIGFGLIHYAYSTPLAKSGYGNLNGYLGNEAYVTYSPPILDQLTFSYYSELTNIWQYMQISYADSYPINDSISIDYGLAGAYAVYSQVQGANDVTANLGLAFATGENGSFTISYNIAYRPELKMYEWLYDGDSYTTLPIEYDGQSSAYDGKITDPSRSQGVLNDYINSQITSTVQAQTGNTNYSYTPRQKIPRYVHWVQFGYTYLFE
ncbi:MAG: hypothetical protein KDK37_05030 [Leptospiraceae bacterium]|nr:hypothetical protein [Leptospiraceae bacterium]